MSVDAITVWFELCSIEEVLAHHEPPRTLGWLSLTDGRYDVVVGGRRIFSLANELSGVEYPVAQLWNDLVGISAAALRPLPPEFAIRTARIDHWRAWVARVQDLDDCIDLINTALGWWFEREMGAMHLTGAPSMRFWRVGEVVRVHWSSPPATLGDVEWSSPSGEATLSAEQFHAELLAFDRRLLLAMDQRLGELERTKTGFNLAALRREHVERSGWLQTVLTTTDPYTPSWDVALEAILELERRIGPSV